MTNKPQPTANVEVKGVFTSEEAVQNARNAIQSAGIAPETISITTQSFKPRADINQTETFDNAKNTAVAGALLGGIVVLFISFINVLTPEAGPAISPDLTGESLTFIVAVTALGMLVGAAGFGLIATISGVGTPKEGTDAESLDRDLLPINYLLIVQGNADKIERVAQILQDNGAQLIS